jgi:hypothetical protein
MKAKDKATVKRVASFLKYFQTNTSSNVINSPIADAL